MKTIFSKIKEYIGGERGDQVVVRKVRGQLVMKLVPPRKRQKPSPRQLAIWEQMRAAHKFAREIDNDPIKKAEWSGYSKKYDTVYQAAVAWYMKNG